MIKKENLEYYVESLLETGKEMKKNYYESGSTQPHLVHLLDSNGKKQIAIGGHLSDDGNRHSRVLVKMEFKRQLKKAIKKYHSHGLVSVSDAFKHDLSGNIVGECLMSYGETKGHKYAMVLPYKTFGLTIDFGDCIKLDQDVEGNFTGYFK
jgi:hypothetical protein